ncbi:MAG: formate dehydrogenase subunit delta [Caulobacteraceae bacterium]
MRPNEGGSPAKLVHMANQIADNFRIQPPDVAVAAIAGHIERYWTPRMRREILDHAAAGGAGLDPLTLTALRAMTPPCQPADPLR